MIEVINPGIHTTIQDRGRFGYRDQGVPLSGAMDHYAAYLANQLVGNSPETALLEFVFQGPMLFIESAMNIAISGGKWDVELDGKKIDVNQPVHLPAKSTLKIKGAQGGMYGYLSVEGGFDIPKVLGSYSFYPHITKQSKLQKGDHLHLLKSYQKIRIQTASIAEQKAVFSSRELEVEEGPEFSKLSKEMQEQIFQTDFTPSKDSNRMAFPLVHEAALSANEISTAPVQPGTVQLTPSGKTIVLMRDAQTTGGYARVLQLSPMAINQLAQKRPGDRFRFKI